MTDYQIENHGSLYLVRPTSDEAREHLKEHTDGQWFAGALAVEPRYLVDLVAHLHDDGYTVGQ